MLIYAEFYFLDRVYEQPLRDRKIVLHWLTLLMVILTYAAMLLKDSVPEAWAPMVKNLHFNFGLPVFALMLIRLAVRSFHTPPPTTPPLEELAGGRRQDLPLAGSVCVF